MAPILIEQSACLPEEDFGLIELAACRATPLLGAGGTCERMRPDAPAEQLSLPTGLSVRHQECRYIEPRFTKAAADAQ